MSFTISDNDIVVPIVWKSPEITARCEPPLAARSLLVARGLRISGSSIADRRAGQGVRAACEREGTAVHGAVAAALPDGRSHPVS